MAVGCGDPNLTLRATMQVLSSMLDRLVNRQSGRRRDARCRPVYRDRDVTRIRRTIAATIVQFTIVVLRTHHVFAPKGPLVGAMTSL
jgi:hypothetical protein